MTVIKQTSYLGNGKIVSTTNQNGIINKVKLDTIIKKYKKFRTIPGNSKKRSLTYYLHRSEYFPLKINNNDGTMFLIQL